VKASGLGPRASALILALAACKGGEAAYPSGARAGDAIVKITSSVPDASLWVDGRYIGTIGALKGGISIAAGTHRVELRHDDYFSRYAELTLRAKERRALALDLAPRLP
jgi:hypothetical protein